MAVEESDIFVDEKIEYVVPHLVAQLLAHELKVVASDPSSETRNDHDVHHLDAEFVYLVPIAFPHGVHHLTEEIRHIIIRELPSNHGNPY